MGMGGTVSNMVSDMSDQQLIQALDASGYKESTQKQLVDAIRESDKEVGKAKGKFGNGVSVKGIVANVSAYHILALVQKRKETGKDWGDDELVPPSNTISPLETCAFFDGKSDGAAKGCRGGMTYRILDKHSVIQGYVSIAWENPFTGDFVFCIHVDKKEDNLQHCLDYCDKNSTSVIRGDVTIKHADKLKQFITAHAVMENTSTAYLLVGIKVDDIVRKVIEGGL